MRTRQEQACENRCNNSVTRAVWDGDQLLYEMRYPGRTGAPAAEMEQDTGSVPLRGDTLHIATYAGASVDTLHVYGLEVVYDLNGRRTTLRHPDNIDPPHGSLERPEPWWGTTQYGYDPVTGQLQTVADPYNNVFRYVYDLEGRVDSLAVPGGIGTKWSYDADGRLKQRVQHAGFEIVPQPGGTKGTLMHNDIFGYDARAKVLNTWTRGGASSQAYSGLGTLILALGQDSTKFSTEQAPSRYKSEERYRVDALANHQHSFRWVQAGSLPTEDTVRYVYESGTGQLQTAGGESSATTYADAFEYDESGNKVYYGRNGTSLYERSRFYYGADQKLRVVDRRTCVPEGSICNTMPGYGSWSAFEEFRYDALGRRVLSRTRQDVACTSTSCDRSVRRYVWDGDLVLYEIRYPAATGVSADTLERDVGLVVDSTNLNGKPYRVPPYFGRVLYTYGQELDRPLSIIRMDYSEHLPGGRSIFPHENWNGTFDSGSFPDGTFRHCASADDEGYDPYRWIKVSWPASYVNMFHHAAAGFAPESWVGDVVYKMRDASGQLYRRNRYYEPSTGRFTQEDPIGLAGGLNLYGYAGGDPVNFSDPFGLCPCAIPLILGGLSAADAALLTGGAALTGFVVAKYDEIAGAISSGLSSADAQLRTLLTRGRLQSDPNAVGPHSVFKRNPQTGQVDKYDEFHPNPRNPNGFDRTKSFQRTGRPHVDKVTKEPVPTPHVNDPKAPGGVRRPEPWEIPPE